MAQIEHFLTLQTAAMVLAAVAAFAGVLAIALPWVMSAAPRIRFSRLAQKRLFSGHAIAQRKTAPLTRLPTWPKITMKSVVDHLGLKHSFDIAKIRLRLRRAGRRGQAPLTVFLFSRIASPVLAGVLALIWRLVSAGAQSSLLSFAAYTVAAALCGALLPELILANMTQRRQQSIRRAFPDALDLLLICVQSGTSIEAALQRVAREMRPRSPELADELEVTVAELNHLPSRRNAYVNLADRCGLRVVRDVAISLAQAERYGTPIARALAVAAQENRNARMAEAERRAAALGAKMAMVVIAFFLPVLIIVIIGPAAIKVASL